MEAYRFENQAKAFDKSMKKEANTSHTFWEKDYLKAYDFKSKFMLRGSLMN